MWSYIFVKFQTSFSEGRVSQSLQLENWEKKNIKLLYHCYYYVRSLWLLLRVLIFLNLLGHTHCLGYALEIDSVHCKETHSATAMPNLQSSYIHSLVFTVLRVICFTKSFSEVFPKDTKLPEFLENENHTTKSYLTEHFGNMQGVIVKDYGWF